jgi:hypothetical protein
MKVNIQITEAQKVGIFADIRLIYTDFDSNQRSVPVTIDFRPLNDFSKDVSSIAFDFFLVSSLVYCIDNLLERESFSVDGWAREIIVDIPVYNLSEWKQSKKEFEELLCFLTGDYWSISFSKLSIAIPFRELKGRWKHLIPIYSHDEYSFASLFSGGLDSLVGVINEMENLKDGEKGLLISHYDGTSPGTNSDQERLNKYLTNKYPNKFDWVQEAVSLSPNDEVGNEISKEPSFRSRSLLFTSIGVFCLQKVPNCNVLIIPENGTISLNYPLTPSRSSTLSTRTTHPYYIDCLNRFLLQLGLTTQVKNPYDTLTKGELVQACIKPAILSGIYAESVSCGKRGRKMNWDTPTGTRHCGVCMPCIYRRAALNKIGLDNQLYGTDIFSTSKELRDIPDMPALIDFLTKKLTVEQIKRTLLVNGSFDINDLDKFAGLVVNVRAELKDWIKTKGSDKIKKQFGLT